MKMSTRAAAAGLRRKAHALAVVALGTVAWGTIALGAGPALAQDTPQGDAAKGRSLYLASGCFECHGRAGQGGAFNGIAPVLAATPLPYVAFKGQMRDPAVDMPAYSSQVMSEQDLADIYAFLRALPGRQDPNQYPQLKP
jgi:mono/diheme cytochrome c family protein